MSTLLIRENTQPKRPLTGAYVHEHWYIKQNADTFDTAKTQEEAEAKVRALSLKLAEHACHAGIKLKVEQQVQWKEYPRGKPTWKYYSTYVLVSELEARA